MERSAGFSIATKSRAKKTAHASEQDRPDIVKRREDWFEDNSTSTRDASSLSTRLGPPPTWRAGTGGRRAANGCA
jgi:hypothetical protein